MTPAAIKDEALRLGPAEKAQLIDALWESLSEPELKAREAAWAAEAERRIDAHDAGSDLSHDADEVLRDLRKSVKK